MITVYENLRYVSSILFTVSWMVYLVFFIRNFRSTHYPNEIKFIGEEGKEWLGR